MTTRKRSGREGRQAGGKYPTLINRFEFEFQNDAENEREEGGEGFGRTALALKSNPLDIYDVPCANGQLPIVNELTMRCTFYKSNTLVKTAKRNYLMNKRSYITRSMRVKEMD